MLIQHLYRRNYLLVVFHFPLRIADWLLNDLGELADALRQLDKFLLELFGDVEDEDGWDLDHAAAVLLVEDLVELVKLLFHGFIIL